MIFFQIAAEVAAPLAKTDEIVLLGGADRTTSEINKLVSQLPPAVSALTGVDLSGVSKLSIAGHEMIVLRDLICNIKLPKV